MAAAVAEGWSARLYGQKEQKKVCSDYLFENSCNKEQKGSEVLATKESWRFCNDRKKSAKHIFVTPGQMSTLTSVALGQVSCVSKCSITQYFCNTPSMLKLVLKFVRP